MALTAKVPIFVLIAVSTGVTHAQVAATLRQPVVCDDSTVCTHEFVNGLIYKTITTDQIAITVAISSNGKVGRANLTVANKSEAPFDVTPERFTIAETAPKIKTFAYMPPEKVVQADAHRAGWANALNAFGAGMATQQVTTQTNSNGTVNATGSDGSSANGTYNGTSTSTTSVPDYAAQARARENIRKRKEALAAERQAMEQTSLRANTVHPGQTVAGFVYFEWGKKSEDVMISMPIGDTLYQVPFKIVKH